MTLSLTCPACRHSFQAHYGIDVLEAKCPLCRKSFALPVKESDEEIVELTTADANRVCESCDAVMAAKAILCIQCGFNHKTGARVSKRSKRKQPQLLKLTDKLYAIRRTLFGNTYWIDDSEGQTIFELKKTRSWLFGGLYEIEWKDAKTDKPVLVIEKTESSWLKRSFQIDAEGRKVGSIRYSRNRLKEPFNMIMKWNDAIIVDMVHHDIDRRGTLSCGQLVYVVLSPFLLLALVNVIAVGVALLFLLSPLIFVLILSGVIPVPRCRFRRADDDEPQAVFKSIGTKVYRLERTSPSDRRDLLIPLILSVLQMQRDLGMGEVVYDDPGPSL